MARAFSLRVYRCRSWIERALQAPTLDERFIFYWIALNSLYGRPKYLESGANRTPEHVDLEAFLVKVADGLTRSDLKGVKAQGDKLLREPYLHEGTWKWETARVTTSIRRQFETANRAWDVGGESEYLKAVCSRLYVLRKQIFHGCATFQSKANRDSLESAVAVLSRLLPVFCEIVEQQGEASLGLGEAPFKPSDKWVRQQEGRLKDQVHLQADGQERAADRREEELDAPVREQGHRPMEQEVSRGQRAKNVDHSPLSGPGRVDRWLDLCLGVEKCLDCIRMAPQAVTQPVKRGEVPIPPSHTRILFVGVAPTAQKKRNGGAHFYSSRTDALRTGLFDVLDRIFKGDLAQRNAIGLNEGTQGFIDRGYFLVHAAKVRPFYDDAPPQGVLGLCASTHLKQEICFVEPQAVCFLGKNNLTAVAREMFGKDVAESAEEVSIASWKGLAAVAPQPRRGWDEATERVIRQLDAVAGGKKS